MIMRLPDTTDVATKKATKWGPPWTPEKIDAFERKMARQNARAKTRLRKATSILMANRHASWVEVVILASEAGITLHELYQGITGLIPNHDGLNGIRLDFIGPRGRRATRAMIEEVAASWW